MSQELYFGDYSLLFDCQDMFEDDEPLSDPWPEFMPNIDEPAKKSAPSTQARLTLCFKRRGCSDFDARAKASKFAEFVEHGTRP